MISVVQREQQCSAHQEQNTVPYSILPWALIENLNLAIPNPKFQNFTGKTGK